MNLFCSDDFAIYVVLSAWPFCLIFGYAFIVVQSVEE